MQVLSNHQAHLRRLARVIAAVALVGATSTVAAGEVRDFPIPASTLTRAEVLAELAQAQREGRLPSHGEATEFALPVALLQRSRVEAVAEGQRIRRQAGRQQPAHESLHHGG